MKPHSFQYAEHYVPESPEITRARHNAKQMGVAPVLPGAGAALGFLAGLINASTVVEIGTGTGVSGLWLLGSMATDGVLTSVDREAENQRLAREAFTAAGYASNRFRLIAGSALDVLSRLTDGAYDIVFIDADKTEYSEYFDEALRLVRPGGVIVFDNALWHDRVADLSHHDPETASLRQLHERIKEMTELQAVLLPSGDGLLAVRALVPNDA